MGGASATGAAASSGARSGGGAEPSGQGRHVKLRQKRGDVETGSAGKGGGGGDDGGGGGGGGGGGTGARLRPDGGLKGGARQKSAYTNPQRGRSLIDGILTRERAAKRAAARDAGASASGSEEEEEEEKQPHGMDGFVRIGAAVAGAAAGALAAAAAVAAAARTAFVPLAAAVDTIGATIGATVQGMAGALTIRRGFERGINRGVDAVRSATQRCGAADYPFTAAAVFCMLTLAALANVNLPWLGGREASRQSMRWRPGDLLPKRFRFRDDRRVKGAAFGGGGGEAGSVNLMQPSQFKTHDKLRSFIHPTELARYGISTEGHQLADRPLLEINDRVVAQWTAPPPPPSDAHEYATERANLPRGFSTWDEHHRKIWLDSKKMHLEELRSAERKRLTALAATNGALLGSDTHHRAVMREHATAHAKDRIQSMVQGAGMSRDVVKEQIGENSGQDLVPAMTYTERDPRRRREKIAARGKKKVKINRRMMT